MNLPLNVYILQIMFEINDALLFDVIFSRNRSTIVAIIVSCMMLEHSQL